MQFYAFISLEFSYVNHP